MSGTRTLYLDRQISQANRRDPSRRPAPLPAPEIKYSITEELGSDETPSSSSLSSFTASKSSREGFQFPSFPSINRDYNRLLYSSNPTAVSIPTTTATPNNNNNFVTATNMPGIEIIKNIWRIEKRVMLWRNSLSGVLHLIINLAISRISHPSGVPGSGGTDDSWLVCLFYAVNICLAGDRN